MQGFLYTSFLQNTCHTAAIAELNQNRVPGSELLHDHPEVLALRDQIYSQLPPGVTRSIELPAEVTTGPEAAKPRSSTFKGFGSIVGNLAASIVHSADPMGSANLTTTGLNSHLDGQSQCPLYWCL
jgi:hypothetical protein